MKQLHIAGNLLKGLLLAGMLTGCQNEEFVTPTERATSELNDQNAKTSAYVKRLVEDGPIKLSYYTSGRDFGLLSKADNGTYTTYYSYGSGDSSDYWIYANTKKNSTGLYSQQWAYHVVNGRCVKSMDVTNNKNYLFTYGSLGRLDEILLEGTNNKQTFEYIYDPQSEANRLNKITHSNSLGTWKEVIFQYGGTNAYGTLDLVPDKYPTNNEFIGLDKYLLIFGQFSKELVTGVTINKSENSYVKTQSYYSYFNWLNADGTVSSKWRYYYPYGKGNQTGLTLEKFDQKYGNVGSL